jgi:hypothetical protein
MAQGNNTDTNTTATGITTEAQKPASQFSVKLTGESAFPPIVTNATGSGEFAVVGDGNTMRYSIDADIDKVTDVFVAASSGGRFVDLVQLRSAVNEGVTGPISGTLVAGNFTSSDFTGRLGIVVYDCGDFIDDYAVDSAYRNDLSFIFLLHLDEATCIIHNTGITDGNTKSNSRDVGNRNSGDICTRNSLYKKNVGHEIYDASDDDVNDLKDTNTRNKGTTISKGMIELIPTKISDFKVNAALLDEADLAIDRMVARCNYLGTKCTADLLRKRIIIRI